MARIRYKSEELEVPEEFGELMSKVPTDEIASRLGTDEETVREAVVAALPALLAKLQDNASSESGSSSLASALQQHNNDLVRGSRVNLDQVDMHDGDKILRHVFGDRREQVSQQIAGNTERASGGLLESLLPMLAPIAMSFLANRFSGSNQRNLQQQPSGPDLGGLIGGLLGGRRPGQAAQDDGGIDIGGLLGGLFGRRS